MSTLYELSEQARQIRDMLLDSGMDDDTIADTLEAETDIVEKIQSYAYVIKEIEAMSTAAKAEAKRIADRSAMLERRARRVKETLMEGMTRAGINKREYPEFTVRIQKNPQSVDVIDEAAIPSLFFTFPEVVPRLDKKALLEALKEGAKISGAQIKQGQSLRVV